MYDFIIHDSIWGSRMKLNILGVEYTVKEVSLINDDQNLLGLCRYHANEILIKSTLSDADKKITLIHEILHAILAQLGFENENDNENLIKSLSTALYLVLKNNNLLL